MVSFYDHTRQSTKEMKRENVMHEKEKIKTFCIENILHHTGTIHISVIQTVCSYDLCLSYEECCAIHKLCFRFTSSFHLLLVTLVCFIMTFIKSILQLYYWTCFTWYENLIFFTS